MYNKNKFISFFGRFQTIRHSIGSLTVPLSRHGTLLNETILVPSIHIVEHGENRRILVYTVFLTYVLRENYHLICFTFYRVSLHFYKGETTVNFWSSVYTDCITIRTITSCIHRTDYY